MGSTAQFVKAWKRIEDSESMEGADHQIYGRALELFNGCKQLSDSIFELGVVDGGNIELSPPTMDSVETGASPNHYLSRTCQSSPSHTIRRYSERLGSADKSSILHKAISRKAR